MEGNAPLWQCTTCGKARYRVWSDVSCATRLYPTAATVTHFAHGGSAVVPGPSLCTVAVVRRRAHTAVGTPKAPLCFSVSVKAHSEKVDGAITLCFVGYAINYRKRNTCHALSILARTMFKQAIADNNVFTLNGCSE